MIGTRNADKTQDPALTQMAGVIARMAESARSSVPAPNTLPDLHLQLRYEGAELQGRTILVTGDNPKILGLSEFQIHKGSDRGAGPTTLRLYLSKAANPISPL